MRSRVVVSGLALLALAAPVDAAELFDPSAAVAAVAQHDVEAPETTSRFELDNEVLERRHVALDDAALRAFLVDGPTALDQPALTLDLLDGPVTITPVEVTGMVRSDGERWISMVADTDRDGTAGDVAIGGVIDPTGEVVVQAVFREDGPHEVHLRNVGDGTYGVFRVVPKERIIDQGAYTLGPDGPELMSAPDQTVDRHDLPHVAPVVVPTDVTDPTSAFVQIQIGFTPQTRNFYGPGTTSQKRNRAKADINAAIAYTNKVLRNSEIIPRVEVRDMFEVTYNEVGMFEDFVALTDKTSSKLKGLKDARVQNSADLLMLIRSKGGDGACGVATGSMLAMESNPAFMPLYGTLVDEGASINAVENCSMHETVAHELGHNFGAFHDRANSSSSIGDYNFGYRVPRKFRTIMSYPCDFQELPSCPRIDHYSSNLVWHNGHGRIGSPNEDVSRKIAETGPILSAFRPNTLVLCDEGIPIEATGQLRC